MMENTARGRKRDRALVAGGQKHEVRYEARKKAISTKKVRKAVETVGNRRKAVEDELSRTRLTHGG